MSSSDAAPEILTETIDEGTIAVITLNRPARHNALTLAMWRQVASSVREFGAQRVTRVILIRGAGERAFASGADLHEMATYRQTPEGAVDYHVAVEEAFAALTAVEQPTIAMIHGYCIGGGCELAVACDLRIADERSHFGIPAAKLGIVLGVDELRRLANLVGLAGAKEILFTGRQFDADEALRMGVIDRVVPADDLESTVLELSRQIVANASIAVGAAKLLLNAIGREDAADEIAALQREFVERAGSSGASRERIGEFVSRRPRPST